MNSKEEFRFLNQAFSSLFEKYKYSVIKYVYNEGEFGNYEVVFRIDTIKLRVIRDKGQIFFEVNSLTELDEWFDLGLVLELLEIQIDPPKRNQLKRHVEILDENFYKIRTIFSAENYYQTKINLKKIGKVRAERMFGLNG
jgi:hypothetical protein